MDGLGSICVHAQHIDILVDGGVTLKTHLKKPTQAKLGEMDIKSLQKRVLQRPYSRIMLRLPSCRPCCAKIFLTTSGKQK